MIRAAASGVGSPSSSRAILRIVQSLISEFSPGIARYEGDSGPAVAQRYAFAIVGAHDVISTCSGTRSKSIRQPDCRNVRASRLHLARAMAADAPLSR